MHDYMYIMCKQYFNYTLNTYTHTYIHVHIDVNSQFQLRCKLKGKIHKHGLYNYVSFQFASLTFVFVKLLSSEHIFFYSLEKLQVIFQHSQKKMRLYMSQPMIKIIMLRAQALS